MSKGLAGFSLHHLKLEPETDTLTLQKSTDEVSRANSPPPTVVPAPLGYDHEVIRSTPDEKPTRRCESCENREETCHTTATQLACVECHRSKTGGLYASPSLSRHEQLVKIGECPLPESAKAAGKRKRREEDEDEWTGVKEVIKEHLPTPGSSMAKSNPPGSNVLPPLTTCAVPVPTLPAIPATSQDTPAPGETVTATNDSDLSTLSSLQRELGDSKRAAQGAMETTEKLAKENVVLWGHIRTLLAFMNQMTVRLPVLEAELRGLRNGMEVGKLKNEIRRLKDRVAELEEEESEEESPPTLVYVRAAGYSSKS